jgi:hypothetical protein
VAENNEPDGMVDPSVQPFVDFWSSYIAQANQATSELINGVQGNADAKQWQRRWFETLSRSMDAYLRSPIFLKAMRENTDLIVKAKRQTDDLAAEFARNAHIPTTSDISGLFERLHSVEEVILRRMDRIEVRLTAIEQHTGTDSHSSAYSEET